MITLSLSPFGVGADVLASFEKAEICRFPTSEKPDLPTCFVANQLQRLHLLSFLHRSLNSHRAPNTEQMVRLKHRYLLVDILYPDPSSWPKTTQHKQASSQSRSQIQIHAPTSDALTPGLLAKMVRDEVAEIFGDWGIGRLGGVGAGGVSGKLLKAPSLFLSTRLLIFVAGDI